MAPMAPNAPSHKPADPILYSFGSGDELSKGLADFVIKVGMMVMTYGAREKGGERFD